MGEYHASNGPAMEPGLRLEESSIFNPSLYLYREGFRAVSRKMAMETTLPPLFRDAGYL